MLNFKWKPDAIKKKLIKSLKRDKENKTTNKDTPFPSPNMKFLKRDKEPKASNKNTLPQATTPLPFSPNAAICTELAKTLFQREQDLTAREAALEAEQRRLHAAQAAFEAHKDAQETKHAQVRRGATMLFRMNRLQAQQDRDEQDQAHRALERGLLAATQAELDVTVVERETMARALLTSAAAYTAATATALASRARADAVSTQLTAALDAAHHERLHLAALTDAAHARQDRLDVLVEAAYNQQADARSALMLLLGARRHVLDAMGTVAARAKKLQLITAHAKYQRAQIREDLLDAKVHARRFGVAAGAIALVQAQVDAAAAAAAEARETHDNAMDKEREEARTEMRQRFAALTEARTVFEKLRATEKANLARDTARVEALRVAAEKEKEVIKKEKTRALVLGVKAEQERAAAVEAKTAALANLQAAVTMRGATRVAARESKEPTLGEILRESRQALQQVRGTNTNTNANANVNMDGTGNGTASPSAKTKTKIPIPQTLAGEIQVRRDREHDADQSKRRGGYYGHHAVDIDAILGYGNGNGNGAGVKAAAISRSPIAQCEKENIQPMPMRTIERISSSNNNSGSDNDTGAAYVTLVRATGLASEKRSGGAGEDPFGGADSDLVGAGAVKTRTVLGSRGNGNGNGVF